MGNSLAGFAMSVIPASREPNTWEVRGKYAEKPGPKTLEAPVKRRCPMNPGKHSPGRAWQGQVVAAANDSSG